MEGKLKSAVKGKVDSPMLAAGDGCVRAVATRLYVLPRFYQFKNIT